MTTAKDVFVNDRTRKDGWQYSKVRSLIIFRLSQYCTAFNIGVRPETLLALSPIVPIIAISLSVFFGILVFEISLTLFGSHPVELSNSIVAISCAIFGTVLSYKMMSSEKASDVRRDPNREIFYALGISALHVWFVARLVPAIVLFLCALSFSLGAIFRSSSVHFFNVSYAVVCSLSCVVVPLTISVVRSSQTYEIVRTRFRFIRIVTLSVLFLFIVMISLVLVSSAIGKVPASAAHEMISVVGSTETTVMVSLVALAAVALGIYFSLHRAKYVEFDRAISSSPYRRKYKSDLYGKFYGMSRFLAVIPANALRELEITRRTADLFTSVGMSLFFASLMSSRIPEVRDFLINATPGSVSMAFGDPCVAGWFIASECGDYVGPRSRSTLFLTVHEFGVSKIRIAASYIFGVLVFALPAGLASALVPFALEFSFSGNASLAYYLIEGLSLFGVGVSVSVLCEAIVCASSNADGSKKVDISEPVLGIIIISSLTFTLSNATEGLRLALSPLVGVSMYFVSAWAVCSRALRSEIR